MPAMMYSSPLSENSLHFSGGFVFVHFFLKYQIVQMLKSFNHYAHLAKHIIYTQTYPNQSILKLLNLIKLENTSRKNYKFEEKKHFIP